MLAPQRRETLLRRVSASPKLARALNQQLVAIEAVRRLDTPAPTELRERIQRTIHQMWNASNVIPCSSMRRESQRRRDRDA